MKDRHTVAWSWTLGLLVAAAWATLIWAVHRESPRTLVSFHGFIHAAITERFLETSAVSFPPENPFFAGEPAAYYWFFHFVAAGVARALGCNVFYALELVILAAAAMLVLAALKLGRVLFQSTTAGLLICYLVIAGTNPLGWVYAGLKFALRGRQALVEDPGYLWGVVSPLYSVVRFRDMGALYGPLVNFFLNVTSRPVALAALMLQLACLGWVLRTCSWLPLAVLALASALTTALSPIIGISVCGTLVAGFAGFWIWQQRQPGKSEANFGSVVLALAAVSAGVLLAAPTYYHLLTGPSDRGLGLWLFSEGGLYHILTLALSVLPLAWLAWVGVRGLSAEWRPLGTSLFFAAVVLLLASAVLQLPSSNESNFFHAAVVVLAVPAAGSVVRVQKGEGAPVFSRRRAAALFLGFLPTPLIVLGAYLDRPPIAVSFSNLIPARVPPDSDLAVLYVWVRSETSKDAIFVIDPRLPRVTAGGNISEFPAMTNRAIFTEHRDHYLVRSYPDAHIRYGLAVRLLSGDAPGDPDRSYLRALRRPIYLVSYRGQDGDWMAQAERNFGASVFYRNTVAVFRWKE